MKHIMLVEDEVELAQLVPGLSGSCGFWSQYVHDGQAAYDSFAT